MRDLLVACPTSGEAFILYSAGSIYCDVRRHLVTQGVLLECIVVL
jgi:hypothetical protein